MNTETERVETVATMNINKITAIRLFNIWGMIIMGCMSQSIPFAMCILILVIVYSILVYRKYDMKHFIPFYKWECTRIDRIFKMFRKWDYVFRQWIKEQDKH